ncbi:MAG: tetratricopeptide repeat protein [bacterium JZ-2024 1]
MKASDEGARIAEEAERVARACGSDSARGFALRNLGALVLFRGQIAEFRERFEESLRFARAASDSFAEASCLNNPGVIFSRSGEPNAATDMLKKALAIPNATGDGYVAATTLSNLENSYQDLGDLRPRVTTIRQALRSVRNWEIGKVSLHLFIIWDFSRASGEIWKRRRGYSGTAGKSFWISGISGEPLASRPTSVRSRGEKVFTRRRVHTSRKRRCYADRLATRIHGQMSSVRGARWRYLQAGWEPPSLV